MPSVLSTKLLSQSQTNLLLNAGLSLTEYNFIQTKALSLSGSISEDTYPNAIVTSQTTVDLIKDFKIDACFCVGRKTASKLRSFGFPVECVAESGKALAERILEKYSKLSFTFFGSAQRRPELAKILGKAYISLSEIFVYETIKTAKTFNRDFDAVLCFSPMGVDSFFEANPASTSKVICIGNTTATQAKLYSKSVFISNTSSVESVIVKAVKLLK